MPYTGHSRSFRKNRFVYPVLSRRSKGISVGINLNPNKVCNFNCIYCQVDRNGSAHMISVDIRQICQELTETLKMIKTGEIFLIPPFDRIPSELRHLSDIALSGDGEPTMFPGFYEVVQEVLKLSVPPVLITNSSGLNRSKVQDAIDLLYNHKGEVWAKLDAGSDEYYKRVSRSTISLTDIVSNILSIAKRHPVVIQSCFNRIENTPPPLNEIESYCNRLNEITESGGKIRLVQIYTVARPPSEDYVTPLSREELTFIAQKIEAIADLPTEIFD